MSHLISKIKSSGYYDIIKQTLDSNPNDQDIIDKFNMYKRMYGIDINVDVNAIKELRVIMNKGSSFGSLSGLSQSTLSPTQNSFKFPNKNRSTSAGTIGSNDPLNVNDFTSSMFKSDKVEAHPKLSLLTLSRLLTPISQIQKTGEQTDMIRKFIRSNLVAKDIPTNAQLIKILTDLNQTFDFIRMKKLNQTKLIKAPYCSYSNGQFIIDLTKISKYLRPYLFIELDNYIQSTNNPDIEDIMNNVGPSLKMQVDYLENNASSDKKFFALMMLDYYMEDTFNFIYRLVSEFTNTFNTMSEKLRKTFYLGVDRYFADKYDEMMIPFYRELNEYKKTRSENTYIDDLRQKIFKELTMNKNSTIIMPIEYSIIYYVLGISGVSFSISSNDDGEFLRDLTKITNMLYNNVNINTKDEPAGLVGGTQEEENYTALKNLYSNKTKAELKKIYAGEEDEFSDFGDQLGVTNSLLYKVLLPMKVQKESGVTDVEIDEELYLTIKKAIHTMDNSLKIETIKSSKNNYQKERQILSVPTKSRVLKTIISSMVTGEPINTTYLRYRYTKYGSDLEALIINHFMKSLDISQYETEVMQKNYDLYIDTKPTPDKIDKIVGDIRDELAPIISNKTHEMIYTNSSRFSKKKTKTRSKSKTRSKKKKSKSKTRSKKSKKISVSL